MKNSPVNRRPPAVRGFKFKKFEIKQEGCAVKVGTLGCILGAFAFHPAPDRILDIGTGTGLLALMLAQRYNTAIIDAVEIDEKACSQARENITGSPWSDRLAVYYGDVEAFGQDSGIAYQLIVSNPPFFERHFQSNDPRINIARHDGGMTMTKLLESVFRLLDESGYFFLLLPEQQMERFTEMAALRNLFPIVNLRIFNFKYGPVKAMIRGFSLIQTTAKDEDLIIWSSHKKYSQQFAMLQKDFYRIF